MQEREFDRALLNQDSELIVYEQFFQNNLKKLGLAQIVQDAEDGLLAKQEDDGQAQPEVSY